MTKAHMAMLAAENKKLEQAGLYRPETIHPDTSSTSRPRISRARATRTRHRARTQALDKTGSGTVVTRAHRHARDPPRARAGGRAVSQRAGCDRARLRLPREPRLLRGAVRQPRLPVLRCARSPEYGRGCACRRPPRSRSATTTSTIQGQVRRSRSARFRAIVTDGVFPFDDASPSSRHLRARREVRRDGRTRRFTRRRRARRDRKRHPRVARRDPAHRRRDRHVRQGAWWRGRRLHRRQA